MSTSGTKALSIVFSSIGGRLKFCLKAFLPFALFRPASAGEIDPDVLSNSSFVPTQSTDPAVLSDIKWRTTLFNFKNYRHIGDSIRSGTIDECYGNLSLILDAIGPIAQASSSGSSGALTFLPTAGALIGAPAKELWILYKLIPFAGILSMLLSLGGNIVPNSSTDYERDNYKYDGIIGSTGNMQDGETTLLSVKGMDPQTFAAVVKARAENPLGGSKWTVAAVGIASQLFWIGVIIFACWFTESGAVLDWWCQAWGWMLAWYLVVGLSSLFENFVLVPFDKQWTLRISKAPSTLEISEDAPIVTPLMRTDSQFDLGAGGSSAVIGPKLKDDITVSVRTQADTRLFAFEQASTSESQGDPRAFPFERRNTDTQKSIMDEYRSYPPQLARQRSEFLYNLEKHGYNTVGQLYMDPERPWASSRHSFMVIISVTRVTHLKATLRVASKAVSVGVFAAGTAAFASASLITISVAVTALCLILGAGVFGRVAAMWMVSEMMKENPIIHRVVHTESEAETFINEVLNTSGLTVELLGHVFINGRCVKRYNTLFSWFNIFGILVSPFKVESLMTRRNI
ncbi:hypothetical protein F4680DRAFT_468605 [Xylaria scruposa]|nr:hypothetical protein F4680DRAFT_468605 [Xylaria scruposa]